ncbi:leucine-rich repeat protein SHOC-2-like [Aedes albopictus]|uniref:Uncharacterized protein n=1 Tax=Aedes albopictus TaxID=7160 RepID=A0ABM1Z4J0_AEDAL
MNTVLILLVLAETFNGITSWVLETDPESDYSNVKNFQWTTDSSALQKFSHLEQLHFINATIDTVTQNFKNQLKNCVWLKFTGGKVKTVYMNSKLSMLNLQDTSTEKVIIEPGQEYILGTLVISRSRLTRIPHNINQLKQMNRLDIMDSWIETVLLNDLDGLDNLYEINLSGNRIRRIDSNGLISFPKLFRLKLQNNQLQQLDTCRWSMPELFEFLLNNNRLTHFAIGHFSSLNHLTLASNPLNCAWLKSLVSYRSFFYHDIYTCDESSQGDFGLHCPSNLGESNDKNANRDADLTGRFQKIDTALQKLEAKLSEQRNMVNDIIESIYRTDVERAFESRRIIFPS